MEIVINFTICIFICLVFSVLGGDDDYQLENLLAVSAARKNIKNKAPLPPAVALSDFSTVKVIDMKNLPLKERKRIVQTPPPDESTENSDSNVDAKLSLVNQNPDKKIYYYR